MRVQMVYECGPRIAASSKIAASGHMCRRMWSARRTFGASRRLDSRGRWGVRIIFDGVIPRFPLVVCFSLLAGCGPGVLK